MEKVTLVLASNNPKKINEIRELLPQFQIKSLKDIGCNTDIPETADTFEGNAFLKAKYVFENYGLPCFADDSGLVIDALDGAPGIYSARYAGPKKNDQDNMDKVLKNLTNVKNRNCYFTTVICFYDGGTPNYFEGRIHGEITHQKIGDKGFGYDPIFIPNNSSLTFAQLDSEEKNKKSHRGIAIQKFTAFITKKTESEG